MIIGISGKLNSGKDSVARIVQYFTDPSINTSMSCAEFILPRNSNILSCSKWQTKRFADKLKDIVCLLIGCTREELEDREFKEKELGEEWIRYGYANGFTKDNNGNTTMLTVPCDKERYELEVKTNWQTAYKVHYTPRLLLQHIGTDLLRNQLHPNVWVNALMSDYGLKSDIISIHKRENKDLGKSLKEMQNIISPAYASMSNWLIPDVRFPNELKAIKDRDGVVIRVNRHDYIFNNEGKRIISSKSYVNINTVQHISETALDDATFDYVIDNNGTIEELVEKVREILVKLTIIQ